MAKLVYGLQQTLDGFIDHTNFDPTEKVFRYFIENTRQMAGSVYGRVMYDVMRYWDEDQPDWGDAEREYAAAWRDTPKWVVSTTLDAADLGPNATLVSHDLDGFLRKLKRDHEGEIEIAGARLANTATELGAIDEYRIYLQPVVAGHGKPYFAGARPALRLDRTQDIGDGMILLTYVPA